MVRLSRNEKHIYQLHSRHQMQSLDLTMAMTLTLDCQCQIVKQLYLRKRRANWLWTKGGWFTNTTLTFWWARWGVRIYPIVTRVTSDASGPWIHIDTIHILSIISLPAKLPSGEYQNTLADHAIIWNSVDWKASSFFSIPPWLSVIQFWCIVKSFKLDSTTLQYLEKLLSFIFHSKMQSAPIS